jgi:hypothetical protein
MAKGLLGGMTDYNHQSFPDILGDIENEKRRTIYFRDHIQKNIDTLTANSYWTNNVPFDFKNIVGYAIRHYNTAIAEFDDIHKDLRKEVKEHHIKRLNKIATVAQEINVDIGKIWHQQYHNKQYGNSNFSIVEDIYAETRDMAVNLLDTANIAERLNDYIGKTNPNMTKNNPWISGLFYLTVAIIVIIGLAVLSNFVHWTLLPIIIISGILLIGLVGTLQLKNDDKITDKSFVSLITETFKRLPLIGQRKAK